MIFIIHFKPKDKVNLFPTTYFIGINGQALEILEGIQTEDELYAKIQKTIEVNLSFLITHLVTAPLSQIVCPISIDF